MQKFRPRRQNLSLEKAEKVSIGEQAILVNTIKNVNALPVLICHRFDNLDPR